MPIGTVALWAVSVCNDGVCTADVIGEDDAEVLDDGACKSCESTCAALSVEAGDCAEANVSENSAPPNRPLPISAATIERLTPQLCATALG
jgi:hypothetical protein